MKVYSIRTLTVDNVKEMISQGDDNHRNQIRVTKSGEVFLSQDIVGASQIENLAFRFESFDAHNDYVGSRASADEAFIKKIYDALKYHWEHGGRTYVDDWNC